MPNLPEVMDTCPCGYSLKTAKKFLDQAEISRMMVSHIKAMHQEQEA